MKFTIIIPSRFGSERFPGKPLSKISGKSLIERVWSLASSVKQDINVVVATDDDRIAKHVHDFGGQSVMTNPDCRNGSERVYEAYKKLNIQSDVIINLQGDAPLTPPWIIEDLCNIFISKPKTTSATCAVKCLPNSSKDTEKELFSGNISGTYVVFNANNDALYFSRYPIPYERKVSKNLPTFRHVGIYAYTPETLETYINLEESELEKIEGLEQLRLLYHGYNMQVVEVDYKGRSHLGVDTENDRKKVERIIEEEGELL